MLTHEVKINDKVVGKVFIETNDGKHETVEIWMPEDLISMAINSNCKHIGYSL